MNIEFEFGALSWIRELFSQHLEQNIQFGWEIV